jgi:hypothetical protein
MPNICGNGPCNPATCTMLGYTCGMWPDGCNSTIDCGTCASNLTCGGGGMKGQCGTICVSQTCAQQGFDCGMATDGCGNVINCGGSCPMGQICGAAKANKCGSSVACTGLCMQQMTCPMMGQTTSVSGTVYAPNGTDPVYNALVYVPNGGAAPDWGVQPFVDGVDPPHCSCGTDVSGSPLLSVTTGVDGTFTLNNMPVGVNIPLVIQNGRWRRMISIPNVPACTNTALTAQQTRFPTVEAEFNAHDNIPRIAFVTGSVDSLECVLRKIGIADSAFSDPMMQGGNGRVRFYEGGPVGAPGASYSANTPYETQLWGTQAEINSYDMVFFACQGNEYDKTAQAQQTVIKYADAGGRIFATHYSYVWFFNDTPFSTTALWNVNQPQNFSCCAPTFDGPETGYINTGFPKGMALAQWLQVVGASTTYGQMQINVLRRDFDGVVTPSSLWIYVKDPNYPTLMNPGVPMHYTFDTPVGMMAQNQCGRVLYDDFHVEDNLVNPTYTFPTECAGGPMTPQEKMLEFMIFDLGSCVAPPKCIAKTCAQQNAQCGPVGDGCGGIVMCGVCPSGKACINGQCQGSNCMPMDCSTQNYNCGMQGDGCGNIIDCGMCPSGQTCGGSGTPGKCGNGMCMPGTCPAGWMCGSAGDGCGSTLNCGMCAPGQICGGGGVPGQCYTPNCVPQTCASQMFNCGQASDGCGNIIDCGPCMGTCICGGGGKANVCGGCSG